MRVRFFGPRSSVLGRPRKDLLKDLGRLKTPRLDLEIRKGKYVPERGRYGGEKGTRVHEMISWASSKAVLAYSLIPKGKTVSRAEFSIVSSEVIFDALSIGPGWRLKISGSRDSPPSDGLPELAASLAKSLQGFEKAPRRHWEKTHPEVAQVLRQLHEDISPWKRPVAEVLGVYPQKSSYIVSSYIHMHFNRLGLDNVEERLLRNLRNTLVSRRGVM